MVRRGRSPRSPTTPLRPCREHCTSACPASASTATTSPARRRRREPWRWWSSGSSTSTCRSCWCAPRGLAMGPAADTFYGHPSHELDVIGVTGTNGKTTTAFLMYSVLEAAGLRPGLLGTVESRIGGPGRAGSKRTTPESVDLQAQFRRDGRRRRPELRDGGVVARAGAGAGGRHALRRRRLHQPDAGPPRLPRDDGGVLPGQARGCSRTTRGRRPSTSATRTAGGWRRRRPGRCSATPPTRRSGRRAPQSRRDRGGRGDLADRADAARPAAAGRAAARRFQRGQRALRGGAERAAGAAARGGAGRHRRASRGAGPVRAGGCRPAASRCWSTTRTHPTRSRTCSRRRARITSGD